MYLIQNGRIETITCGTLQKGSVLIENGKIAAVGEELAAPKGTTVIDAAGMWVTPGLIDAHTHICTNNKPNILNKNLDLNEFSSPITPQIRAADTIYPKDAAIPETRRAGFTTCCVLPGSTNLMGGIGICIKLKDGQTAHDLVIPGSEQMKFAMGENPKRYFWRK